MTELPTRRSVRAAHGRRRAPRTRSRGIMAAAGAATLLMAGSVLVAVPADAATTTSQQLYASQLLGNAQSLNVAADVSAKDLELASYGTTTMKGASGAPALTVGGQTNADWAALVLQDAGLPVTQNNVTVILQWMDSENSPQSWWLRNNPLNNGLGSGGGSGFGSYANLDIAAQYVAQQLGRSMFGGIATALAADSAPAVTEQAIIASPWAGSHYGYGSRFHAVNVPIVAAPASHW